MIDAILPLINALHNVFQTVFSNVRKIFFVQTQQLHMKSVSLDRRLRVRKTYQVDFVIHVVFAIVVN